MRWILRRSRSFTERGERAPTKKAELLRASSSSFSDTDIESAPGSDGSPEPLANECTPHEDAPLEVASIAGFGSLLESESRSRWPLYVPRESLLPGPRVPIRKRVEHDRILPNAGLQGCEGSGVAKASAHKLNFTDTRERLIQYALRPSKKKTRNTFLEVSVDGGSPWKARVVAIHDAKDGFFVRDGRDEFRVRTGDVEVVTKGLILLCKISRVRLDCLSGSPALRKVLSSLSMTAPLKTALSCGDLQGLEAAGPPRFGPGVPPGATRTASTGFLPRSGHPWQGTADAESSTQHEQNAPPRMRKVVSTNDLARGSFDEFLQILSSGNDGGGRGGEANSFPAKNEGMIKTKHCYC